MLKLCARCCEWYSIECFHRKSDSPDGRQRQCTRCRSRTTPRKRAEWAILPPDVLRRRSVNRYNRRKRRDPAYRERERAWQRDPVRTARHSAQTRERRAADREAYNAARRQQRRASPEKRRAEDLRRRFRDPATIEYACVIRGDPCAYCGCPAEHVDHIEAAGGGGLTHWTNLTGACRVCNGRKHAMPLLVFLLRRASGRGG